MKILLFAIMGLAVFHFVYDAILLPSMRFSLRNRLFKLRDELRMAKIDGLSGCSGEAFDILHNGINNYVNRLDQLTWSARNELRHRLVHDKEFRSTVERRIKIVEDAGSRELRRIAHDANIVIEQVVVANCGGWAIYLAPIVYVASALKRLSELSKALLTLPAPDADRVIARG